MNKVEVQNLSFSYDGKSETLNKVSFSIEKGSYVSIVGHNGSGKSTLAKLIIGLLDRSGGDIFVDGIKLEKSTVYDIRKKVALVFQNPDNQFIGATVEDDIAFGLENKRVPSKDMRAIIEQFASEVGMLDNLEKEPNLLSGGQKQRVAIAGALALSPEIIIFDEATSMLDPAGKRDIANLILKLRKINPELTVISITHDMEEAYNSDKVIVLSKGEIVYEGKPNEILAKKENLSKIGLYIPFVLTLKEQALSYGLELKGNSIDELVEEIWASK